MEMERTAPDPIQDMLEPMVDGRLRFACHPGVPCFTECCRELSLLLTPYDVVRLRNGLGLSSREFLDRYGEIRLSDSRNLPTVYLKMQEDERMTCPFVSEQGCGIYDHRPSACRTYPLARASRKHRDRGVVQESYYVLHEEHCKGFEEGPLWTIAKWIDDQGLAPYHEANNLWMEILTHPGFSSPLSEKQQQMFFIACYNSEQFLRLILNSRFLGIFDIPQEEAEAIQSDDEALLRLAYRWIRFSFLGEPALTMRERPDQPTQPPPGRRAGS